MMKATATLAVLCALLSLLAGPAAAQTDTDILNFALNLECLEVRIARSYKIPSLF